MKVYGLDISLTGTGISDGQETWLVRSAGKADDDLRARQNRLWRLQHAIVSRLASGGAGLVVVEAPAFSRSNGHSHDRSGLFWLVVDRLIQDGIPVAEVAPTALKKYATGKGNAGKGDMIEATVRRLPHVEIGGDDNRADSAWLACMGYDHLGSPLVPMPAANRAALTAVRWPDLSHREAASPEPKGAMR